MTKTLRNNLLSRIKENRFISNSATYILASFVIKGISFISTPIFTRLMGAADYGIVSNFQTWGHFLACFLCFQVAAGVISAKMNVAEERIDEYTANMVVFSVFSSLLFSIIIFVFSGTISNLIKVESGYIFPLMIYSFGSCMTELFSSYCIATNRVKSKVVFAVFNTLLIVLSGIAFVVLLEDKSMGRIVGFTIGEAIISVVVIWSLRKGIRFKSPYFMKDIKFALAFGVPLIPHIMANLINGNADRVYIIRFLGEKEAGIYSVAYGIGIVALTFANAASDAWTPWYFENSKLRNKQVIGKYFKLYTITIGMCFAGVMLLAPEVMKIMGSSEYWSGKTCIPYVALGIFFLFLYRFPLCYEQLNANTKYVAPGTIAAAIINLILNYYMIPLFGINGAAVATTVSYVALWGIHEFVARKTIKKYDISFKEYIPSLLLVLFSFVLSIILVDCSISRYIVTFVLCGIYLYITLMFVKERKDDLC